MTQSEKIKTAVNLVLVQGRIKELVRSKAFFRDSSIFRDRFRKLEDLEEELLEVLDGKKRSTKDESEKIVIKVHVPEEERETRRSERKYRYEDDDAFDFIQYLRREKFVID